MQVANQERQQKIRRKASTPLLVYDLHTELPMGQILDMSAKGMKLMTEDPIDVKQVYYLKIPLDKKIKKRKEVFFDAECRWCKLSDETGWYNSGYVLRFPSPKDAEVIRELMHVWMADETGKFKSKTSNSAGKKRGYFRKIFSR